MTTPYLILPELQPQEVECFWQNVNQEQGQGPQGECWEWVGGFFSKNHPYGRFNLRAADGRWHGYVATRVAYALTYGEPGPMFVCHSCDNPPCVRPSHLKLGTPAFNTLEMTSRGRHYPNRVNMPSGRRHYSYIRRFVLTLTDCKKWLHLLPAETVRYEKWYSKRYMPALDIQQYIRFWSRVDKTPGHGPQGTCWLWLGGKDADGYGRVSLSGITYVAPAVSLSLAGHQKATKQIVCHQCDNPPCVNPEHLFYGTPGINAHDRKLKGRIPRGPRSSARMHIDKRPRGEKHYSKMMPERLARGDRNGSRTKPERRPRGDEQWCARFTPIEIAIMREEHRRGKTPAQIIRETGAGRTTIHKILKRLTWKHLA